MHRLNGINPKSIKVSFQSVLDQLKAQAIADMARLEEGDRLSLRELVEIFLRSDEMIQFAIEHASSDEERRRMLWIASENKERIDRVRALAKRMQWAA